jgi:hypothetical protein
MSVLIQGDQVRANLLGIRVAKASAILPATGLQTLFTVTGGRILVTSLIGEVTVVFDGTTNSLNVVHDPDGAGAVGDISGATVCTSDAVGTLYTVHGIQAALLGTQKEGGTEVPTHVTAKSPVGGGFILPAGLTKLQTSATDTTGATKWVMTYIPLDNGASVA